MLQDAPVRQAGATSADDTEARLSEWFIPTRFSPVASLSKQTSSLVGSERWECRVDMR
jgi:hypothetical protein